MRPKCFKSLQKQMARVWSQFKLVKAPLSPQLSITDRSNAVFLLAFFNENLLFCPRVQRLLYWVTFITGASH